MSDAVGNSKRVRIDQFTFNHRGKTPGINVFRTARYDPNLLNNIENPYSPVVNTISRELPGYLTSDDILEITLSWRAAMQVPFYFTIQTNKLYMRRLMRMQLARLIWSLLQFLKSHGPGEAAAKNMRLLRIHRPAPMEEEEENDRDRWEIEVIMEDGHRFESHHLQFLNLSPIHHRLQWQYEPRLGRNVAK
ncbi:hypothetical protein PHLCEN_2v6824 [Hermanssonia centrifuga]|uniref:Uncharacterized protein n=1 Tax=Hermanssonia centrifuga TaxID=98765 RepID=A0A2R6NYC0_9APHY|nr:hypothetical protein PHLCEN_2v6824 [Hermanssonia centrifuga]